MRDARCVFLSSIVVIGSLGPMTPAQAGPSGEPYPSLRVGSLRADLRMKLQGDWRRFPIEPETAPKDAFDLHRARIGVEGTFLKFFDYQVERELRDRTQPWRDVYLNARVSRAIQIQVGNFKIPFSREQLTGSSKLDFAYRSLAGSYLAPGRDRGLMVHGSVAGGAAKYQAGVFRRGGENIRASEAADPQSGRTIAARVSARPWHRRQTGAVRALRLGLSITSGTVPEGLYSVRGHTIPDDPLFHPVFVNGDRRRVGLEADWEKGRLAVTGEFIHVNDERRGQSTDEEDLPTATGKGWHVAGTWHVTDRLPLRLGGVAFAARLEDIQFGSGGSSPASGSARAANILEKGDRVVTAGMNWAPTRWTRLQVNLIRERRREGSASSSALWSRVVRLQFTL